jgi:hypothetical protein
MPRNCFIFLFLLTCSGSAAQFFKVHGKITNNKLEPLALASVQVKELQTGTVTREDGTYELKLEEGKYDLVISMMGFKSQLVTIVVDREAVHNFIMEAEEAKNLAEVTVRGKLRDRSEEYIRNVIRHKDELLAAAGPYSCTVYIKAVQEDSSVKKKKGKQVPDSLRKEDPNADLQHMAMAEIVLKYDHENDNRVKEERTAVKKRGEPESLFYLSMTEGDFNLYNNLIRSRVLSEVPFLSPVSYSGLAAYKYKITHTKIVGKHKVYTISVKPKQLSNVTVEGELIISDSNWVLLKARFSLPSYHIPEYDFFEISQEYSFINDKAWMISRQEFTYYSTHGKGKLSGKTVASYLDFEFNKKFPPKHFGVEISATAQQAYDKDSLFWEKTRTEPLTSKEIRFIQYKDSIYRATHSKTYLDSIDRLTNKVTWKKLLLFGQSFYDREKERTWYFPALTSLYQPIQFGGARLQLGAGYNRIYKSRKTLSVSGDISYGFRNKDVNGNIGLSKMYNPFNRAFYRFEAGRDFEYIFEGDAWINMIKRSNQFLNNAIGIGHGAELVNGLFLYTDFDIALRRSLSNYKTNSKIDSLFDDLLDGNNQAPAFEPYNAAYGKIRITYTPRQRYIREPREKIILGSKWPTFYVEWRKGIPGFINSKVDFDYLEFGLQQQLKLGIAGISRYTIRSGSFPTRKDLRTIDYKFQRRGDPLLFLNPNEAFQSLDSTFPVFDRFYEGHYLHEFNGALINKIPFLKKLQLREVAGAGFLIAPERNLRYAELFAGVERVFKWPFNPIYKFKLGVYVVGSAANQFRNPLQFKIGIMSWDRKRNKWI